MHYPYSFTINRLRLDVHLGWLAPEREGLQPVEVELRLYFSTRPACMEDDNGAFPDYHDLCRLLERTATERPHRLIEFMATRLFDAARSFLDAEGQESARLWLRLTKSAPPVEHLLGGASFVLSDLAAGDSVVDAG